MELLINLLISIFANGITTLANRYDSDKEKRFEKLKKQLKENNALQKTIVDSLKSIKVEKLDFKEIDNLKILVSDDVFSKMLADIITNQSPENSTVKLIVSKVKEYCNFTEDQTLSIEPFIKKFVNEFYGKILKNPELSPYLIIKEIEESTKISQREHSKIFESLEGLHKKYDESLGKTNTTNANVQLDETEQPITAVRKADKPQGITRVANLLINELEEALNKLNISYKSRVDEIKGMQKENNFGRAIELYESLLNEADGKIDKETIIGIYADCALCSINIDEIEWANDWLCKAEKIETNDKRILAVRGFYYYELGDKEKAKKCVDNALIIDTFYHLALVLKTSIELEAGTNGRTILYQYFLDENGNVKNDFKQDHIPVIYRTIGQCYAKDSEVDKAIEYFERSLYLNQFDDGTLSLVGTAYLNKALGENIPIVHFDEQLSSEKEDMVRKAIEYYTKALELAARPNKIKDHISTNANLSMCYTLLGKYDEAYNISEVSSTSVIEDDSLLKSKATAAYYKGFYNETAELLSKVHDVTCQDIINSVLALLQSNKKNKEKEALVLIEDSLRDESFKTEDLDYIRYLKFDILLSFKDLKIAEEVLKELETSTLPEWQKERVRGDYYGLMDDHDKTDTHYKKALKHHDIDVTTRIVIADYYYRKEIYETCFGICSSIPMESIKSGSYIFERLLRMLIVTSFNIPKLDKCREYIAYGKQQKIKDSYLYEISASIYWQEDELETARDELFTVLEWNTNTKNINLFSNYALVSFMLGDFKTAQKYFSMAETMPGFFENTNIVINCIITFIVIGNKIKAKRIFEEALGKKFENKDDKIHKFAPSFYFRENNANLFAKYAIEFNKKHGDTAWLWKKDIKKDKEELKAIFSEGIRHSIEIRKWYLKSPVPLVFLPSLLWGRGIIHLWSFNREYDFPIFLESGNPKELKDEILTLSKEKSILVDYTALLTLQEAGSEHLWLLENAFDEIYIYRPMYLQMLNELMLEEHHGLREVIKFISESKKIKFLKRVTVKKLNIEDKALASFIQEEYSGLFQTAHGKQMVLLVGESRLKGFARSLGIVSCGIRSLLEHAKQKNIIDNQYKQKAIANLIKKYCQFISFDRETIEYICTQYPLEEFKNIFNKLSDQILLSGSESETFTNVYCGFIKKYIEIISNSLIIKYLIEKTISDIKILTFRASVFYEYPSLKRDDVLTDMSKIDRICLRYIYLLLLLIYSSEIDEKLKLEYVEVIKKEANLLCWCEIPRYTDRSIIRTVFEKAKRESRKRRAA